MWGDPNASQGYDGQPMPPPQQPVMMPQAPQPQSGPSAWGGAGLPEKRPVLPFTLPYTCHGAMTHMQGSHSYAGSCRDACLAVQPFCGVYIACGQSDLVRLEAWGGRLCTKLNGSWMGSQGATMFAKHFAYIDRLDGKLTPITVRRYALVMLCRSNVYGWVWQANGCAPSP